MCTAAAWLLTALSACAVSETDGWHNREGSGGGEVVVLFGSVCVCVCMGWQSKEARRWLRDFEAQPSLVASLPVCVADNMLTPRHLIGYPGWSRLGLVTLCPDPDSPFLHAHILDQFRGQLCCYKYRNIWCMLSFAYAHIKFMLTRKGNF